MNLQLILNKNSPGAHMELEFDFLDVARKACGICGSLVQKEELREKNKKSLS